MDLTDGFVHFPQQLRYEYSKKKRNIVACGRQATKTATFKRRVVREAMKFHGDHEAHFGITAPTYKQVKRIYWDHMKQMVPKFALARKPLETELRIQLINGSNIWLFGMDQPERMEGMTLDGGGSDEYGNMKPEVFEMHIEPALTIRDAWWDLLGVPEGRNHYYQSWLDAQKPENAEDWDFHAWTFEDVAHYYMGKERASKVIERARRTTDPLTFDQEYNAKFVSFEGRAYYCFDFGVHCAKSLTYFPKLDLDLCFDFNVSPSVCAVTQEISNETHVIGEVFIPKNGTTPAVCNRIIQDWGDHKGEVVCFGDATGGNKGTAKIAGSDWDLIEACLRPVFGDRLRLDVPKMNPPERARVNAVNSRCKSVDGTISLRVDPDKAPKVAQDLDGTMLLKGGSGELDKKKDSMLSHISDALGYKIVRLYPIGGRHVTTFTEL